MFEARSHAARGQTDSYWRTGFQPTHRAGSEAAIVQSVFAVYAQLFGGDLSPGGTLVDIGGGSGELCLRFTMSCQELGWTHIVVDSSAMLAHLPTHPNRQHIHGRFPDVLTEHKYLAESAPLVVAYSVMQYAVRDMSAMDFLEGVCACLRPGGAALIGDIPNRSKRSRHLSAAGVDPTTITTADAVPITDDTVLDSIRCLRLMGLDAYCLPQHRSLRTWEHREDLWIHRPDDQPYLEVWE